MSGTSGLRPPECTEVKDVVVVVVVVAVVVCGVVESSKVSIVYPGSVGDSASSLATAASTFTSVNIVKINNG